MVIGGKMENSITTYKFPSQAYAPAPASAESKSTGIVPAVSNKLTQALNGIQLASGLDDSQEIKENPMNSPAWQVYRLAAMISVPVCAYHGYKRNKSVGWALWWAIMGGAAPVIAPTIAFAQGFGKERQK